MYVAALIKALTYVSQISGARCSFTYAWASLSLMPCNEKALYSSKTELNESITIAIG